MSQPSDASFQVQDSLGRMDGGAGGERWFSLRAIGVSLVLIAVFAYFLPYWYLRLNLQILTGFHLPAIAIFPVLVLLLINAVVRKLGVGLDRGELTVVLCTLLVSLGSLFLVSNVFTALPSPVHGATEASGYADDFLWTVDERLLPYEIADRERAMAADQYQESLNWFYSGVPERPPEGVDLRYSPTLPLQTVVETTTGTMPALNPPPHVQQARVYLEPPPLRTPWWRWIRKHGVDREARLEDYRGLAELIRQAEGLEEPLRESMLAEVAILKENVGFIYDPQTPVFPEHALDAYDSIRRRLGRSRAISSDTRRELRIAIEQEQQTDTRFPPWRWTAEYREERLAAYDALSEKIRTTEDLESALRDEILEDIDRLRMRQGAQQPYYRALLAIIKEAREQALDPLAVAIEKAGELDGVDNTELLNGLILGSMLGRLERLEPLDGDRAAAMREMIDEVAELWGQGESAASVLEQLEELTGQIKDTEVETWWADIESAIRAEKDTDLARHWWHWDMSFGRERAMVYVGLAGDIRASSLPPSVRRRMVEQAHGLIQNAVRTISDDASAYARMSMQLRESTEIVMADRRAIESAIDSARESDFYAANYFQEASPGFYGWTGPLVWWMVLLVLLILLQFCIAAVLRRQWVDHEKLLFPHVEMFESAFEPGPTGIPGGSMIRNPLFWVGFFLAVGIFTLEGLHVYWPEVPGVNFQSDFSLAPLLSAEPWSAIPPALDLHLFIIAIVFLLPAQISFSVWVFVLLDFALRVYMRQTGVTWQVYLPIHGYLIHEGTRLIGGLSVFVIALMFSARRHLAGVVKKAFLMGREVDDSQEPIPYFGAFWGVVLSAVAIMVWCVLMGMNPFISFLLFTLAILAIIFLTRVVCELGIPTGSYQVYSLPQRLVAGVFGFQGTPGKTFLGLPLYMTPTFATWACIAPQLFYGVHMMPFMMTSDRFFRPGNMRRRFTGFIILITIVVMGVFAVRSIQVPYQEGAFRLEEGMAEAHGHNFANTLQRDFIRREAIHQPFAPNYLSGLAGAIIMAGLLLLRHLFYWWPLHPIGFIAVGLSGGVWFSVFIGWFIKRAALKYGGGSLFQKAIPFFVGLLVGHFVIAGIWLIVGAWRVSMGLDGDYSAMFNTVWGRST